MQAIITAGRTGFGSPGQVMAAKNGPVGPKFTPDRIFRDSPQSLFFPRRGTRALRAGKEKEGPGTHCMRMRYKNLMNLIIK